MPNIVLKKEIKRSVSTGKDEWLTVSVGGESDIEYLDRNDLDKKSQEFSDFLIIELATTINNAANEFNVNMNKGQFVKYGNNKKFEDKKDLNDKISKDADPFAFGSDFDLNSVSHKTNVSNTDDDWDTVSPSNIETAQPIKPENGGGGIDDFEF